MSLCHQQPCVSRRFHLLQASFLQRDGLPFADVLPEEDIERAFTEEGVAFAQNEDCVYTPHVTLWAFLSQVLHKEEQRSCLAAVSRILVLLISLGLDACAKNSGAYCKARAKLPTKVIRRLATELADGCEQAVPPHWLWRGRHVKLVDGTTVSMPDTEANQHEYPQQSAQAEGLGFPIARMIVLLSLATGMMCDMAMGRYSGKRTGEPALFREVLDRLDPQDIVLADRIQCSYFMIALLLDGHRDLVVRLHQARKVDYRKTQRLGAGDHLITWTRPKRPAWMDQQTYEQIPETITLRLVEIKVSEPGFRTRSLVVVSTLSDPERYPKDEIAVLYRRRWLAELDIRAIKSSLGMDILRCKSPEMVRKEIWVGLLAYNLIRKTILQAALQADLSPRELSFTTAMQTIAASLATLPTMAKDAAERLITAQLTSIAEQRVGRRPNRIEPRAVKRRPKPHPLLMKPREQAREELVQSPA